MWNKTKDLQKRVYIFYEHVSIRTAKNEAIVEKDTTTDKPATLDNDMLNLLFIMTIYYLYIYFKKKHRTREKV